MHQDAELCNAASRAPSSLIVTTRRSVRGSDPRVSLNQESMK